jgi:hypothetical protein
MKHILRSSALAFLVTAATLSAPLWADDTTASSPTTPAPGGSPASTDSKNQENTPAGPANQAVKADSTTPADSKASAGANSTVPVSQKTKHPSEATKSMHKHHHHHKKTTDTSTNAAPANP